MSFHNDNVNTIAYNSFHIFIKDIPKFPNKFKKKMNDEEDLED